MKKVKKDAPRQARRTRALARFSISRRTADDVEHAAYLARKEQERHALHAALGI